MASIHQLCSVLASVSPGVPMGTLLSGRSEPTDLPTILVQTISGSPSYASLDRTRLPDLPFLRAAFSHLPAFRSALPDLRELHRAELAANPVFAGAVDVRFGGTTRGEDEVGWRYGLIGQAEGDVMVAALAPFLVLDGDLFAMEPVTRFLRARLGDRLTVSPL